MATFAICAEWSTVLQYSCCSLLLSPAALIRMDRLGPALNDSIGTIPTCVSVSETSWRRSMNPERKNDAGENPHFV